MASLWAQNSQTNKTAVTVLQELCVQEGDYPVFENVPHESDPKMFSCEVKVFDYTSYGSGRSKKEAKHDASANILGKLHFFDFLWQSNRQMFNKTSLNSF